MKRTILSMFKNTRIIWFICALFYGGSSATAALSLPDVPLFVSSVTEPPLVLLTMGRDHKLFYEAYNDASDLNDDGNLDIGYDPTIDYYGYFDSGLCYVYDGTDGRFEPSSVTANKKCTGATEWSGHWLSYITTSRMDAIRGVFYGGLRSTDTATTTVLERAFIPQDAHSWGKEFNGAAEEGYDITEYTPLVAPGTGKRHLFANTTLLNTGSQEPRLRIITNTDFRVWDWLSIERPVADTQCGNPTKSACAPGSSPSSFSVVPSSATDGISSVSRTLYNVNQGTNPYSGEGCYPGDTNNDDQTEMDCMDGWATGFGGGSNNGTAVGTETILTINNTNSDAFGLSNNYYVVITGQINVTTTGSYQFAVDGDDAQDFSIDLDNDGTFFEAGENIADFYSPHGFANNTNNNGSVNLTAGSYNFRYRMNEIGGGAGYRLHWAPPAAAAGGPNALTDYFVRIQVCVPGLLDSNCKLYPNGNYKPTGILHDFGETDKMKFGLLSGSWTKNLSGGVLRKKMGSITDEIDANNGTFTAVNGIISSMDKFKIPNFQGNFEHQSNCGFIFTRKFNEGECRSWGNPIAEMMYEGLRYFAGKSAATSSFAIPATGNDDATLGLPLATWDNPYDATTGANVCAKPMQLVISDINPSYDSNSLPGSYFSSFTGDVAGMNVQTLSDTITSNEPGVTGLHFIGESDGISDGAPSPKTVTDIGQIRGLAPEEPTKEGSYYSSAVGYYGKITDINPAAEAQNLTTLAVAIASPLPKFEIPIRSTTITLVPFAKSVGGGGISAATGSFQPTDTITDFYVEEIVNTNAGNADATVNGGLPRYKFRINYEDAEQGADHDMDAITEYTVTVNANGTTGDTSDDLLDIQMNSTYAAGGVIQHMGYIISGTTKDGTYLEVRDSDTATGSDPDFFLDTPPGVFAGDPGTPWDDNTHLPLTTTRQFTPGTTGGATLLNDPLWFAAKWGGFEDENDNNLPDLQSEWDADSDGVPDNYFLVTNASKLEQQLEDTFNRITELVGASASSVAINSTVLRTNSRLYQARFTTTDWSGEVSAFSLNSDATIDAEVWTASDKIPTAASRNIFTMVDKTISSVLTPTAIAFDDTDDDLSAAVGGGTSAAQITLGDLIINYIRGDQSNEVQNGGVLRNRSILLGDVVNSSPISVSNTDFVFNNLPAPEGTTYDAYLASKTSYFTSGGNTFSMIYVGANDGMLHAFQDNYDIDPTTAGTEKFAFVPSNVHSKLSNLASINYDHDFYVDATPAVSDVYINSAWTTILSGTLGNGGRAIYTLDISDPLAFNAADVLWEYDSTDNAELGHVMSSPSIVRLNNNKWGVIVGNGYNSASQKAQLFILDAEDGTLIKQIDTGIGSGALPNGLARPFMLDTDGDRIADFAYAGDLQGNMWKFDIADSDPANWDVAYKSSGTPVPLYTASDDENTSNDASDDTPQAITTRPVLVNHPDGGYVVLFGTGKYLETTDSSVAANPQTQTFYGIRDNGAAVTSANLTNLQQQSILSEIDITDDNGTPGDTSDDTVLSTTRVVSENTVDYTAKDGWYMELVSPVNGEEAERVIANPLARFGRIIFTTFIPKGGCEQGGLSTIMELDAVTGARLENSVFDLNSDGVIDANDFVDYGGNQIPGSGIFIPATLASPAVITADDASEEFKLTSGMSGTVTSTRESTGGIFIGRQSWRQLR